MSHDDLDYITTDGAVALAVTLILSVGLLAVIVCAAIFGH